ncbi:MAG TPA: SpvB/TcaC N-terminal domain-containing protein, partial [Anaerolineae bacterium]|nr:SpvB/TcaC N-terminal domain-containing protein [Anaerolineae bacterium]
MKDQHPLLAFRLESYQRSTGQVQAFNKPARLVVDLRAELAARPELNPAYTNFYLRYREEGEDVWHTAPIQIFDEAILVTEVTHFSEWQAGLTPEGWTPLWSPPTVSSFSGSASYSYPLQAPAGRGGVGPNLALSYSSRSLDGAVRGLGAGFIAPAWSMAEIKIVRTGVEYKYLGSNDDPRVVHRDRFRLIFNGTGYDLFPKVPESTSTHNVMRYYVKENPSLRVTRYYNSNDAEVPNVDGIYWRIETGDGKEYRLGYTADAEEYQDVLVDVVNGGGAIVTDDSLFELAGHLGHANNGISAVAWYVDTVTDPLGNVMSYHYTRGGTLQEMNDKTYDANGNEYFTLRGFRIHKSRLTDIYYNYPN